MSQLYDSYGLRLYHYLLTILRSQNDAEDVLQEVFLRLVRQRRRLRKVRNLTGYLFATARNEARRFMKRRHGYREAVEDLRNMAILESAAVGNPSLEEEEVEEINKVLARLPQDQREVMVLKVYEELSFRGIAQVMRISPHTAASRYRYGIEKLRNWLGRRE